VRLDARARDILDPLGDFGQRGGPELPRLAFERMRRDHQGDCVLLAHGLLDPRDALGAIFTIIAEDADETWPQFGARFLEVHPVDDTVAVVPIEVIVHLAAPISRRSGAVPRPCLRLKG